MSESNGRKNRLSRKSRCVAIWIGQQLSEAEVDDYLYAGFQSDFEVLPEEENVPEFCALSDPRSIRRLLSPFSFSSDFIDAAVARADASNIERASAAVIFYHTHVDASDFVSSPNTPLIFLGNVEW